MFDTEGKETTLGGGTKSFDPYAGPASGAIRLGLQMLNGCAILASGEPVGTGTSKAVVPGMNYPASCPRYPYQTPAPVDPNPKPIQLVSGTTYFLNQITIARYIDSVIAPERTDLQNPNDMGAVMNWMRTESGPFTGLDWANLGVINDIWEPSTENVSPYSFSHIIELGNANWQGITNDTWTLRVFDSDGRQVLEQVYEYNDFLAQNAAAGHMQLKWSNINIAPPVSTVNPGPPQDPPPPPPGFLAGPGKTFRTLLKYEQMLSTHPSKSFKLDPGATGDGAITLTWSQLPKQPFVFPVTFVRPTEVPARCFSGDDWKTPVPCGFGLDPEVSFTPPMNGKYYMPGETVRFRLALKDGNERYLHPPDRFPSYNEYLANQSNGIIYMNYYSSKVLGELDTIAGFQIAGPKQDMRPPYELNEKLFFIGETEHLVPIPGSYGNLALTILGTTVSDQGVFPGGRDTELPNHQSITLATDIKPGTYTLYWKAHRQFMGERITKMVPFDIQVGQEQKTGFPGRVGNCQICHRGTISMDNIRHGLPVDYAEGCTSCHHRDSFGDGRVVIQRIIHQVHMQSTRFPLPKNDCTLCHLTRESAIRPSYLVCSTCHPQPHGTLYTDLQIHSEYLPSSDNTVFGNCAQQCHGVTVPTAHILPAE